ncbi:SEC-C metal-binding domain-containing protein [Leptospira sarikeiensis]|uniref:Zinc chelation protein SecC n=1 Tax=Leptospira sarikeiensis TaxID=2484943 RepID=A0A4R9K4T0_9LEPT|nr:SEC-C metal-binding domain-containing protein [Leptospira sarikeiensis]TGL61173.1 zinc chelation protein SecC [Leptospira sarikeiensis]
MNNFIKPPFVPDINFPPVKKLLSHMNFTGISYYVNSQPEPDANREDCFINVQNKINLVGGRRVIGWAIWILPKILIEAQFHAIWESPEGEKIDITPRKRYYEKILFFEDPYLTYDGYQRNNIRIPLYPFEPIDAIISVYDRLYEIMNKGERKFQHGKMSYTENELEELDQMHFFRLEMERIALSHIPAPNSPCNCGSGRKYKKCCGF